MPAGVKIYLMISLNIIFFAIRFVQKVCKYLFLRKQPQFVKVERKVMKLLSINHVIVPWIKQQYFANCITSNIIKTLLGSHLYFKNNENIYLLTLSRRRFLSYRNQSIDFYMIGTSVVKEFKKVDKTSQKSCRTLPNTFEGNPLQKYLTNFSC